MKILPVQFESPPVAEVACGVMFSPNIKTVHIGLLWQRFQNEFPRIEEAVPIPRVIEGPANALEQQIELNFSALPELRRTWFLNQSGGALIQVQEDRFLFNWKRVEGTDSYPSYHQVIAQFEKHFSTFCAFFREANLGALQLRQFELTYINIIGEHNGLGSVGFDAALRDHVRSPGERFLPEPEARNWTTNYLLPNNLGRLHVSAQNATMIASKEKVMRLELVARGRPTETDEKSRRAWFDVAHEWITHGFTDVTVPALHKSWGRKA